MHAALAPNHIAAALQALADILEDSQATITHRLRAACTILRFSMRPAAEQAPTPAAHAPAAILPRPAGSRSQPIPAAPAAPPVSPLFAPRASLVRDLLSRAGAPPPHFARACPAPLLTLHPP